MQREQLKILLLQIRDDHKVRAEELESFARYSQVDASQIEVLNVFDTPSFDFSVLEGYDALYVGGASEANVLEPRIYPFVNDCISLINSGDKLIGNGCSLEGVFSSLIFINSNLFLGSHFSNKTSKYK